MILGKKKDFWKGSEKHGVIEKLMSRNDLSSEEIKSFSKEILKKFGENQNEGKFSL
ncbi:hypothetical protein A33Q_0599 [Indibacter alkaliphilus LW1]|uniref:Uncharacterized protein n=1 Tax=Indibacter alkaliphilus (strain CCUG 57479 / KCTC 22604 / LW1) TaxID=1189612 RepID=S2E3V4_INDAL|nr:hypothetical protein A33Q_0599 [Indibacter alkaliphilus LW1]